MEDTLRQKPLSCVSQGGTILIYFFSESLLLSMNVYEKYSYPYVMRWCEAKKNKINNKDNNKDEDKKMIE